MQHVRAKVTFEWARSKKNTQCSVFQTLPFSFYKSPDSIEIAHLPQMLPGTEVCIIRADKIFGNLVGDKVKHLQKNQVQSKGAAIQLLPIYYY